MAVRNYITNSNYHKMWCKHVRAATGHNSGVAGCNLNILGKHETCCGLACPDLVIKERDGDEWIGYCGCGKTDPVSGFYGK